MRVSRYFILGFMVVLALGIMPGVIGAEEFKIAVLQVNNDSVQTYQPLIEHLAKRGIAVRLVEVPANETMTKLFSTGQIDAMFSGSGIPGSMFVIHQLRLKKALTGFKPKESRVQQAMLLN